MFGDGKRLRALTVLLLWGLLLLPLSTFGASTGQIKGVITDKDTGEAVIGASVAIVGTTMGAQTDLDGRFTILRLEPGKYTVRITSIQHSTVEVTDVKVRADLTTEVNQALEKKVSDIDKTITVVGKVDIIDRMETASKITLTSEQIKTQPVTTVDAILSQVAGVQTNTSGEVFIRGGRANEVAYIVDGVPIGDPLGGAGQVGASLSLVSGSISEIQIIKDGFDPEYGNALSGIVKITTRTGSKDNTRLTLQYMTDDLAVNSLNKFSRNYDYMQFSLSGPDPFFKDKFLPAIGLTFLEDKEFTYYFYSEVSKDNGTYQYDKYDSPTTRKSSGGFNLLGINIPERLNNSYYYMTNLKFRPKQNLKFILSYKDYRSQNTEFDWDFRYSSANATVIDFRRRTLLLEVSQAVSKNFSYEVIGSWLYRETTYGPGDPNNPGHALDPYDFTLSSDVESYTDLNGNGVYDAPEPVLNLYPDTANYGEGFWGPGYTDGERFFLENTQGGGVEAFTFLMNNNGYFDSFEGEPYIDLNGNGQWDRGDALKDKNGNGIYDLDRAQTINQRNNEPYIDGDYIIGEPFIDVNRNGIYDRGIDIFNRSTDPLLNHDKNYNGKYDGPCYGANCNYEPGLAFEDRNGNGVYDRPNSQYDFGEPFTDRNGNGRYDQGGQSSFLDPGSYATEAQWQHRVVEDFRLEGKAFRQMGNHEFKGGFSFTKRNFVFQDIQRPYLPYTGREDGGPYPERGQYRDMWEYDPWEGTGYFRDKVEYGSMIASLGLRWDWYLQDVDKLVPIAIADDLGSGIIYGDRHKFSPRIGFSYPISDKAKVHFNYGHFFQMPTFDRMYRRNTQSVDVNSVVGNYNLDYQKTIQYSFGVKYKLGENYALDISSYFKDEFDKVNQGEVRVEHISRLQYLNKDYGRAKGFEFELDKVGGGYVSGNISYTFAFASGKASQATVNYLEDFYLSREPLSESPLDNDIRHSFKSSLQIFIPKTVKPRVFGLPIPNDWSLNIQAVIQSGLPFTPNFNLPGISSGTSEDIGTNSMRLPGTSVFDVRFNKNFELAGVDLTYIFWIENLFDSRNVDNIYPATGRADTQQNRNETIFGGTEYDRNPYNWDYGRQIRMGLELSL